MKTKTLILLAIVSITILTLYLFIGKKDTLLEFITHLNIPVDSIEGIKIRNTDLDGKVIETEIGHPTDFFLEFTEIIKEHKITIQKDVLAASVYTDEITIRTKNNIYMVKFINLVTEKGLIDYTVESKNRSRWLIYLDKKGSVKLRSLIDDALTQPGKIKGTDTLY